MAETSKSNEELTRPEVLAVGRGTSGFWQRMLASAVRRMADGQLTLIGLAPAALCPVAQFAWRLPAQHRRALRPRHRVYLLWLDYARTLAEWQNSFQQAWSRMVALGFDAKFKRSWECYLAYCEGGFGAGGIGGGKYRLKQA